MQSSATTLTNEMRAAARALEPDRYLAALLSPAHVRDDLIVLAAFVAEMKRIPMIVSDPHLAEIRLAWWRDALLSHDVEAAAGNPLAGALRAVMALHGLDREAVSSWLDAFAHTFYAAAPGDEAHLDLEHSLVEGTPFAFSARICGAPGDAALQVAYNSAGMAYGLARLGLDFPCALARGRVPLPGLGGEAMAIDKAAARASLLKMGHARLAAVSAQFAKLDKRARTALLPLALVEPYLRASCDQGRDLTRDLAEVAPFTRVWRIWRAHFTGRI